MRTVSLGLAERLKAAGLGWTPKPGDWYEDGWQGRHLVVNPEDIPFKESMIWLPTLSDLLEWLERRGYHWVVRKNVWPTGIDEKPYSVTLYSRDPLTEFFVEVQKFLSDTSEDAAGEAMLWVLEQEAKG